MNAKKNTPIRFHFVVNPGGGSGRALQVWKTVEDIVKRKGVEYSVHFPTQSYLVHNIVHDLTNIGRRDSDVYLVVIGGDGTLNLAVNGIVNFDKTYMGLIPAGSGNDFVHSTNISGSYEDIVSRIIDVSSVRSLDLGVLKYNSCYDDQGRKLHIENKTWLFNNAAGIGFDADVCVKVQHSKLSERLSALRLSRLAYLFAALPIFLHHQGFSVDITVDKENYHYDNVLFSVVMNEPYEGGGFKFCPDATPFDGLLDSCVAHNIHRRDLPKLILKAFKGHHVGQRGIEINRGHVYRIKTQVPLWVQTDGEVEYRSDDITISIRPKALKFLGL
ncbi:diacylglycerol/lipid kinase family protein [Alloscardovia criceti]|uniref:diacylglycerol/lipid kinase family protein n=1 Tax=Alloscardovia criceti TaxID=356828 RepID=UPI0014616946|nr:YegS/Rv2252/BmrU family lipid kinase [Alloscardovia criceti]